MREGTKERTYNTAKHITTLLLQNINNCSPRPTGGTCRARKGRGMDQEGVEKREGGCLSYSPDYFYIAPSIIKV